MTDPLIIIPLFILVGLDCHHQSVVAIFNSIIVKIIVFEILQTTFISVLLQDCKIDEGSLFAL